MRTRSCSGSARNQGRSRSTQSRETRSTSSWAACGSDQIGEVRARYASQLHVEPEGGALFLFLDNTQAPFTDVRVRQAINYAIDRRRLVELGGGPELRQPTCQVVVPDVPGLRPLLPVHARPAADG